MQGKIKEFGLVLSKIRNPWKIVLDKLGIIRQPYILRFYNGLKVEIRPDSGDLYGCFEVLLRGDYTKLGQSLKGEDVVIDVGANIGSFSLLAGKAVGAEGKVIALEPDERNFRQLQRNIALNNLTNVKPIRCCLGSYSGDIELYGSDVSLFNSIYSSVDNKEVSRVESQKVPITTLKDLMRDLEIDQCQYLKIDCEGAEYDILEAMSKKSAAKVEQVTIEVHKVPGHSEQEINDSMENLGYRLSAEAGIRYFKRSPIAEGAETEDKLVTH